MAEQTNFTTIAYDLSCRRTAKIAYMEFICNIGFKI